VHGFAQALTQYSPRVRGQLTDWARTGKQERLIEIAARYLDPPAPTMENRPSTEDLLQDARNQVDAVVNWFAEGKNADSFRRNALAEVDKVVRRASILASTARPSANYAAQLNTLAHQLLGTRDGETAQQLFSVAFANLLPVHLPEGLAGTPSSVYEPTYSNAWQEPPAVTLQLRPVSRSSHGNLPLEDPIIDNRTLARELIAQHENRNREQRERFVRLFADSYLDIGAIESITPDDRSTLMEVIDACLGQSQNQYRAPDGSIITLLNPDERMYALLRAPDGVLLLPRYILERQEEPLEEPEFDDSIVQAQ
jgi:hypothetical protein